MSRRKVKKYSPQLKARVALEAIKGEKSLSELAAEYEINPNLIYKWKKQALEGLVTIFDSSHKSKEKDYEAEIKRLRAKIGELVVERDFLSEIYRRI